MVTILVDNMKTNQFSTSLLKLIAMKEKNTPNRLTHDLSAKPASEHELAEAKFQLLSRVGANYGLGRGGSQLGSVEQEKEAPRHFHYKCPILRISNSRVVWCSQHETESDSLQSR